MAITTQDVTSNGDYKVSLGGVIKRTPQRMTATRMKLAADSCMTNLRDGKGRVAVWLTEDIVSRSCGMAASGIGFQGRMLNVVLAVADMSQDGFTLTNIKPGR